MARQKKGLEVMSKKMVAVGIAITSFWLGYHYWYLGSAKNNQTIRYVITRPAADDLAIDMRDYQEKDHAFVKQLFLDDWYILLSSPTYDVDYMLTTHSPNDHEMLYKGMMPTKVLFVNGNPVGFCSYFMRSEYLGHILFIIVAKESRGHGYSKQLVRYCEQELKKMGARVIKIDTREENLIAQKLYTSLGYIEKKRDHGFVTLSKRVE